MLAMISDVTFASSSVGGGGGVSDNSPPDRADGFSDLITDISPPASEHGSERLPIYEDVEVPSLIPLMQSTEQMTTTESAVQPELTPRTPSACEAEGDGGESKDTPIGRDVVMDVEALASDDRVVPRIDIPAPTLVQATNASCPMNTDSPRAGVVVGQSETKPAAVLHDGGELVAPAVVDKALTRLSSADPLNEAELPISNRMEFALPIVPDKGSSAFSTLVNGNDAAPLPVSDRHVLQQLVAAASRTHDQIELTLTPEELGRVKMTMLSDDGKLQVVIQADRPETLDLIRRHADALDRDFRSAGYGDVQFSFSGGKREGGQQEPAAPIPQPDWTTPDFLVPVHLPDVRIIDGLDLKL